MALKGGSSGGIGMTELTGLLEAFQTQNRVLITVTGRIVTVNGTKDLMWEAKAWEKAENEVVRPLLASAQVRCLEKRLLTMESVLLQLLYALDFQIGLEELGTAGSPKA